MKMLGLVWKFQIRNGNSEACMEIPDQKWKFLIIYGNSGSEMEILDLKWKFWI
jgi:hypothetical protein